MNVNTWVRRRAMDGAWRVQRLRHRLFRSVTFGVRLMLLRDGQVLLVRHTYRAGWYMPGGGVSPRETLEAAARREAREETGATARAVEFMGVYTNLSEAKSDHIVVFVCYDFDVGEMRPNDEIAEWAFFPVDRLPEGTAAGSARRITEYAEGTFRSSGMW